MAHTASLSVEISRLRINIAVGPAAIKADASATLPVPLACNAAGDRDGVTLACKSTGSIG